MPSSKVCGILMILGPLDLNFFFEWAQNFGYIMALCIILHLFFNFSFQKFFITFYFFLKNFSLFFFFWKFHFLKKLFTKDFFFFFENFSSLQKNFLLFFFFEFIFWSSLLARIYCSLPLKVHEILIILGLGMQQRGSRLGSFILGFKGCWMLSP